MYVGVWADWYRQRFQDLRGRVTILHWRKRSCLKKKLAKLPYTLDAVNFAYDVTRPQPQLFVTPDFKHLTDVLNRFADNLAYRRGGDYGLRKAIESGQLSTVAFDTGIEVSGSFVDTCEGYIKSVGASALTYRGRQITGHGRGAAPRWIRYADR